LKTADEQSARKWLPHRKEPFRGGFVCLSTRRVPFFSTATSYFW
jgi:hypothetical protein